MLIMDPQSAILYSVMVLQLKCASQSSEEVVKMQVPGLRPQSFWFSESSETQEFAFLIIPRWCWCCWFHPHFQNHSSRNFLEISVLFHYSEWTLSSPRASFYSTFGLISLRLLHCSWLLQLQPRNQISLQGKSDRDISCSSKSLLL